MSFQYKVETTKTAVKLIKINCNLPLRMSLATLVKVAGSLHAAGARLRSM